MLWGLLGQKRAITINHGMGQAQNQSIFFAKITEADQKSKDLIKISNDLAEIQMFSYFNCFFTNKGHFQLAKTVNQKDF